MSRRIAAGISPSPKGCPRGTEVPGQAQSWNTQDTNGGTLRYDQTPEQQRDYLAHRTLHVARSEIEVLGEDYARDR
jgi:hypothetical protein